MQLKRRQFLTFGGLGGFGFLGLSLLRSPRGISQAIPMDGGGGDRLKLRFLAVGDTGTGTRSQYAVANAMAQHHRQVPFDLALLAGDNIYNNGEIEKIAQVFEKPYAPLLTQGVPFYACLGNHDIRTENGDPQVRYPGFNMKGRYYTVPKGWVDFFVLDTNVKGTAFMPQIAWLDQELNRSKAPWKVVLAHHPVYSSGLYGTNEVMVSQLTPLFKKHNVQVYINGHDHNYERTQPIDGTTYMICGAGAGSRPVGRSPWTAHSTSDLSFGAFDVYQDRLVIQGINTAGEVFDRTSLPLKAI